MSRKVVTSVLAFVCLTSFVCADQICVEFGSYTKDKSWNSIHTKASKITDLKDSNGKKTGVSISVKGFAGANYRGVKNPKKELGIPGSVTVNSLFGDNKRKTITIDIKGLNKDKKYNFTFFASRMGSNDNRETSYEVAGASTAKAVLNAAKNKDKVAEVKDIQPSADGSVVITVTKGKNNNNKSGWFYIGAMKISDVK